MSLSVVELRSNELVLKSNVLNLIGNINIPQQSSNLRVTGSTPVGRTSFLKLERYVTQLCPQSHKTKIVDSKQIYADYRIGHWSNSWSNPAYRLLSNLSADSLDSKAHFKTKQSIGGRKVGGVIELEFINWDKYQPRRDLIHPTWFRLENSLIEHEQFDDFTHGELLFLIYCMSAASKQKSSRFRLSIKRAGQIRGFTPKMIKEAIDKLVKLQILIDCRTDADREPYGTRTDAEQDPNSTLQYKQYTDKQDSTHTGGVQLHWLAKVWNDNCGTLPKVLDTGDSRTAKIRSRLKENPEREYWETVVRKAANSPFCCGSGKTGWKANFDFIIENSDNATKILEGKYDQAKKQGIDWAKASQVST